MGENNQNNLGSHMPQEIPIPGMENSNFDAGQAQNNPYSQQAQHNSYGQNNPYQPQGGSMYGQQIQPYSPNGKKNGINAKIIIAAVCLVVVLVAAATGGMIYFRSTPAYRITKGLQNLAREIDGQQNPMLEKIGMEELMLMMRKEGSHVDSSLNFAMELPMVGDMTIGIDTDYYKDVQAKELDAQTILSVMNLELAHLNVYANQDVFCFSVPELFMEDMYMENENVVSQYNDSVLAQLGGSAEEEDFSINLFPDSESGLSINEWRDWDVVSGRFEKDLEACKDAMTLSKVEKGLYRVSFPASESNRLVKDFLDSYEKAYDETGEMNLFGDYKKFVSSDVSLLFEIDSRNHIESIMLEEPIKVLDGEAELEAELFFLGEESGFDKVQGRINIKETDGETQEVIWQLKQTSTDDFYQADLDLKYVEEGEDADKMKLVLNCDTVKDEFDMTYTLQDDEDDLGLIMEGSLDEIVKGKSLEIDLDKLAFQMNGEDIYTLSGDIMIEPLKGTIEPSVEAKTAFFEMSLLDWQQIIYQWDDEYGALLDSMLW